MSDLTEFLLARIAEDEAVARTAASISPWQSNGGHYVENHAVIAEVELPEDGAHIARHDPARVLAECEAKRETLGLLLADTNDAGNAVRRGWAWDVLRRHAAIHADHPDYREEWRP